ncbi:uncharacterized protein [Drosophila takahashii]|uniref:uncharacterized protein n=1 Tax=Drosophila takahashii TaxID=29030 RepID=UPI001CF8ECED|nr:uncharacterized protein LOC108062187 [Drosophila takahashii]
MRLRFNFVGLLILLLASLPRVRAFRSTGNCSHAYGTSYKFVCKGKVSQDMHILFRDNRAPPETTFSVWESEESNFLISFYTEALTKFETIYLAQSPFMLSHYFVGLAGNGSVEHLMISPSTLHCFSFSLRYPNELRRHCLKEGLGDGDDVAKRPILQYGSLSVKVPVAAETSAAGTIHLFQALLLLVYAII